MEFDMGHSCPFDCWQCSLVGGWDSQSKCDKVAIPAGEDESSREWIMQVESPGRGFRWDSSCRCILLMRWCCVCSGSLVSTITSALSSHVCSCLPFWHYGSADLHIKSTCFVLYIFIMKSLIIVSFHTADKIHFFKEQGTIDFCVFLLPLTSFPLCALIAIPKK